MCSLPPAAYFAMQLAYSLVLVALALSARSIAPTSPPPRTAPRPLAQLEDFRRAAGVRVADTLRASFSIREVRWRPEGPKGAEINAFAFVEDGKPAKVPGPLLRAPAGTVVRVSLHNTLGVQLVVVVVRTILRTRFTLRTGAWRAILRAFTFFLTL